jgi:predicted PurR-regulated permease PerM
LQFDSLVQPLLVLILLGGVQMVMGNVLEPRMMAFSLNLSALLVLVSLIFWGWLWGIWGMILAVPLTATIKIFFENIEPFGPVSVLMSGPVGTTVEDEHRPEPADPGLPPGPPLETP